MIFRMILIIPTLYDESLNEFVDQENVIFFFTHEDEFGRRIISTRGTIDC